MANLLLILLFLSAPAADASFNDTLNLWQVREQILRNADPKLPPFAAPGLPERITVYVGLNIRDFELNTQTRLMTVSLWFRMKWYDPRLKFNGEQILGSWWSNGDKRIPLEVESVWKPSDVRLRDTRGNSFEDFLDTQLTLVDQLQAEKTGWNLFWSRPGKAEIVCRNIDMHMFPFDEQTCEIVFESWIYTRLLLQIQPMENGFTQANRLPKSEEWQLLPIQPVTSFEDYNAANGTWSSLAVPLRMQRYAHFYVLHVVTPLSLLTFLAAMVPWGSYSESPEVLKDSLTHRMEASMALLFTIVAIMAFTAEYHPASPHDTWIDAFQMYCLLICASPICQSAMLAMLFQPSGTSCIRQFKMFVSPIVFDYIFCHSLPIVWVSIFVAKVSQACTNTHFNLREFVAHETLATGALPLIILQTWAASCGAWAMTSLALKKIQEHLHSHSSSGGPVSASSDEEEQADWDAIAVNMVKKEAWKAPETSLDA